MVAITTERDETLIEVEEKLKEVQTVQQVMCTHVKIILIMHILID